MWEKTNNNKTDKQTNKKRKHIFRGKFLASRDDIDPALVEREGQEHKPWVPDVFCDAPALTCPSLDFPLPCATRMVGAHAGVGEAFSGLHSQAQALAKNAASWGRIGPLGWAGNANVTPGLVSWSEGPVLQHGGRWGGHRNSEALALVESRAGGMGEANGIVHQREKSKAAGWDGTWMGWEDLDLGIRGHFVQPLHKAGVQWNATSWEAWKFWVSGRRVQNSYLLIRFTQKAWVRQMQFHLLPVESSSGGYLTF